MTININERQSIEHIERTHLPSPYILPQQPRRRLLQRVNDKSQRRSTVAKIEQLRDEEEVVGAPMRSYNIGHVEDPLLID